MAASGGRLERDPHHQSPLLLSGLKKKGIADCLRPLPLASKPFLPPPPHAQLRGGEEQRLEGFGTRGSGASPSTKQLLHMKIW